MVFLEILPSAYMAGFLRAGHKLCMYSCISIEVVYISMQKEAYH